MPCPQAEAFSLLTSAAFEDGINLPSLATAEPNADLLSDSVSMSRLPAPDDRYEIIPASQSQCHCTARFWLLEQSVTAIGNNAMML